MNFVHSVFYDSENKSFKTNVISDIFLNDEEPTNPTYTANVLAQAICLRHGDKRLFDVPEWFAVSNSDYCKKQWELFLKSRIGQYKRIYVAIMEEYNPLYNYNRIENIEDSTSGSDSLKKIGSEKNSDGGSDSENTRTDSTYTKNGSETTTNELSSSDTHSGTDSLKFKGDESESTTGTDTRIIGGSDVTNMTGGDIKTFGGNDSTAKNGTHSDVHSEKAFNTPDVFTETAKDVSEDVNVNETTTYGRTESSSFNNRKDTVEHTSTDKRTADLMNTHSFNERENLTTKNLTDTTSRNETSNISFNNRSDINAETVNKTTSYGKNTTLSFEDRVDTTTYGKKNVHTAKIEGNIGVTTSMAMMQKEIKGRMYTLLYQIVDEYVTMICL